MYHVTGILAALRSMVSISLLFCFSKSWDCYILIDFYKYFSKPLLPVSIRGARMCGESWLAVKDSFL